jgi:Ubiquitin-2 like Rad60 SUMO-like
VKFACTAVCMHCGRGHDIAWIGSGHTQRYQTARLCSGQTGRTVQLLRHRKLMAAYCNKSSIDVESVAFIFDGQRIRGDQTPGDLDMEDQDEIEVSWG